MTRWSEEQLADYERRQHGMGALAPRDVPEARRERATAKVAQRASGGSSPLERQFLGHLTVMQLAPELQYRFDATRRWRFDFAWPALKVAVELDGGIFAAENGTEAGRHARGVGRMKDYEKRNAAAEQGWVVLCYGPPQVRSGEAALQVERIVKARSVAQPQ